MKKFTLLFSMMMLVSFVFAQVNIIDRTASEDIQYVKKVAVSTNTAKTPTDTIFIDDFFNAGQASVGGVNDMAGYMFGTNWWGVDTNGSTACAQGFIVFPNQPYSIEEVLTWVHSKDKISANGSNMLVSINAIDDSSHYGNSTSSYDIACPGQNPLGSTSVTYNNIDTSLTVTFTIADFTIPIYVASDYAVVYDFADFYLNKDTVGIVAGATGSASNVNGLEYTWYKYRNSSSGSDFWAQLSHIFTTSGAPTDRAMASWPVVDMTGIQENYINGIILNQNYPNPSVGNTMVEYELQTANEVTLTIIDINGRTVFEANEGVKQAGKHQIQVNTSNWAAGTYYYSLLSGDQRLTRKMVIK